MKKFTLTGDTAFFFRNCLNNFMPVRSEEDLAKKFAIFNILSPILSSILDKLKDFPVGQISEVFQKELESQLMNFSMEDHLIEWLKVEWKKVPERYKVVNLITGHTLSEGLNSEKEIQSYIAIRDAFQNAEVIS